MKQYLRKSVVAILVIHSSTACALPAESEIQQGNIIATALTAVVTAAIQDKIHTPADLFKALFWGAAAGHGFYHAKRTIGNGHIEQGLALSYLSSSVAENASLGEHPFAYLRYGVGPFEVRARTLLAKNRAAPFSLDVDLFSVVTALGVWLDTGSLSVRRGMLYGTTDSMSNVSDDTAGYASGRTVAFRSVTDGQAVAHEAIHVAQNIQLSSFMAREWLADEISFRVD